MNLRYKYILFIGVLHLIITGLSYYVLREHKWYFLISEVFIIGSLYLSYLLYKSLIRPVELMSSGIDALRESDFSIKYVERGSTEMDRLVQVFNSMIDKLREEKVSQQEQSFFIKQLIRETPLSVIILDYDNNVSTINPAAQKLLNIKRDCIGKSLDQINHPLIHKISDIDLGEKKVIALNGIDKYKCQVNDVIHQGFKRKFIIIDDLSSELLASEKQAYGRIIRMMAHEVNNSIGAINSILNSVVEYGLQGEEDRELSDSVKIAIDRNDQLNQFMANYASILRLPKPQIRRIDLCAVLKKSGLLFTPIAAEKGINISFDFTDSECPINGDDILLEQAISNIIKNAIESIGENGEIIIHCDVQHRSFEIRDNGPGVDPDLSARLFTPFFSTKPTGQGVGLMLIKEILMDHKAVFSLRTNKDTKWTTFRTEFR